MCVFDDDDLDGTYLTPQVLKVAAGAAAPVTAVWGLLFKFYTCALPQCCFVRTSPR